MKPSPDRPAYFATSGAGGRDVDRHRRLGPVVDRRVVGPIDTRPRSSRAPRVHSVRIRVTASRSRAKRSLNSGHGCRSPALRSAIRRCRRPGSRAPGTARPVCRRPAPRSRVIAERRRQHAGAHDDAAGARAERAQPGERERRMAADMPPRLEMVADEHRIEADRLRLDRELQQLRGANCSADALYPSLSTVMLSLSWRWNRSADRRSLNGPASR